MDTNGSTTDKTQNYNENIHYAITHENMRLEEENKNLKRTVQFYQAELEKFRTPPFLVSEVIALPKEGQAVVKLPNQSNFLVQISNEFKSEINVGDSVINEQKSLVVMDTIELSKLFPIENYVIVNKNLKTSWSDIGGLSKEIEKVQEVLEKPLQNPEIFRELGVQPPKGVLLHGPPGTGKTLIAKALAKHTNATYIELVGSELVQKFIGEGAKLVKELFEYARKHSPTIIFIDELDAIASRRIENGTSGEREVQRTFMQLLGEIDGFNPLDNVKIIATTNRIDVLDEAILRPGRLERHIEINKPSEEGRLEILNIHTSTMKLSKDVNLEEIARKAVDFNGSELKALSTEAGYLAIKGNKKEISNQNFLDAIEIVRREEETHELLTHSFH
ncbi:MAG: AAA family ATPase [Nanoarchaeota archaeon]|nr:AAA family ATPase [Nanoarchaeota archaeon]